MKKLFILLMGLLIAGSSLSTATARTAHKKNKAKTTRAKAAAKPRGYAHLALDPWVILHPVTAAGLGLKGNVKTITSIVPVFDGQFENEEGASLKLTFAPDGRIMEYYDYDFGDACGHEKVNFTYDDRGRVVAATIDFMTATQDPWIDNQNVISDYSYTYKDGRLTNITEHTRIVWEKPVNWPVYHFTVSYTPEGQLSKVQCVEQPKVSIEYRGDTERTKTHYNDARFTGTWGESQWKYYAASNFGKVYWIWLPEPTAEETANATFERDRYGNWTKFYRPVSYDGYSGYEGWFRRFTYY